MGPTTRFCPTCRAQVQATDGYCLLGHSLALESPAPMRVLREQVDEAFRQAGEELHQALAANEVLSPALAASEVISPTPPPPPSRRDVFETLTHSESTEGADPLREFAPGPRMDWGPERSSLLRRRGN